MHRNRQKGEGRLGLIVALAVIGVGIFLGVKIIPVRINAYALRDFVEEECRYAAVHKDDAQVAKRILARAEELEIPLTKKNLKVKRSQTEMTITANFEQPIDLKVTTYVYRYDIKEKAPLF